MQKSSIALLALMTLLAAPAAFGKVTLDKLKPVTISGKVCNAQGEPVRGASVSLIDHDSHFRLSTKTDETGHFLIKHERVQFDSLQIVPPTRLHLAQAELKDLPRTEGRHILVTLKPGIEVTGRVTIGGQPLRGATVHAIAKSSDVVHDRAEAITNKKGLYTLLLTPGEKIFEITDIDDSSVVGLHRASQVVRASGALPDIEIPANRSVGAR
jgi:hypothetical protein